MTKKTLSQLQTEVAKILNMERGLKGSKRKYLDHKSFKEYKKLEEKTLTKKLTPLSIENRNLEQENKLLKLKIKKLEKNINDKTLEIKELELFYNKFKEENKKLKQENNKLTYSVKDLKKQISELRKEMISLNKTSGGILFTREDYTYLSKIKKLLKSNNIEEMYKKILNMKNKIEQVKNKQVKEISI